MKVHKSWDARHIIDLTADDMVHISLQDAECGGGSIEQLAARTHRLADIVARLVERLPENQWLEVTGLQYSYQKAE